MTVSTLAAPLRRVAPESLADGLRTRLAAARARGLAPGARVLADGPQDLLAALVVDGSVVAAGRPLTEGERASELLSG